jgi:hypothetical protein
MNTRVRVLGTVAGTLGFLVASLALVAAVLLLALTSIYRATCGERDSARPQYIVVLPGQEVPEDCRRARSGYRILVKSLDGREGE